MKWRSVFSATILAACFAGIATAADWPMWRYDAGRTAASPTALPKELHLQWVRQLPAPRPAWPTSQTKLQFDASYEPVVAGKQLFVGSMVDDAIRAFSTAEGSEIWRFYTDGPVRFAPVAADGRVFAVSDDGHLYCLDAASGKLHWKVNGGPRNFGGRRSEVRDRRAVINDHHSPLSTHHSPLRPIIGNHRLVSTWPARGGPVYADGVVYFAASIWPSMGIFIHAVDAKTGKTLWTNSETGSQWVVHPHGAPSFGSIVPQGHLAVSGDALIVPGGRSTPAVFDRKTGKQRHFFFDRRVGHHRVFAKGDYYFVGGSRYAVKDGAGAGSATPQALTDDVTIAGSRGKITGTDLRGTTRRRVKRDRRGRVRIALEFSAKSRWTVTPTDGSPTAVHAVAGNQIFTANGGRIARFAIPAVTTGAEKAVDTKQAADWTAKIDGDVWTTLAADDRLFVVTTDGKILCFGKEQRQPKRIGIVRAKPQAAAADASAKLVNQVMRLCGMEPRTADAGRDPAFIAVLGIADYDVIRELVQQANAHAVVIDPSARLVEGFRMETTDGGGLYGTRVAAHVGNGDFPFPPYFASAMLCLDRKAAGVELTPKSVAKLFAALRPYGGTMCLRLSAEEHAVFAKAVKSADLSRAELSRAGEFTLLRRIGPLPKSAGWTHQYGDAANSVVSNDDLVKAPLGVLWFGGPSNDKVLPRHGHGPNPQVAGGRLVIEGADMLRAVDVYTGRRLWETELKGVGRYYDTTRHFPGAGEIGSNYVTLPDAVYVVYGARIIELDAETGKERRSYRLKPEPGTPSPQWGYACVEGGFLVATSTPVQLAGGKDDVSRVAEIPKGHQAVIPTAAVWKYLAGSDPKEDWTGLEYDDGKWKSGKAGFGYGDDDDRTVLRMRGRFTRVYIRREFDGKVLKDATALSLLVNYDDALIAYLNGTEIARAKVAKGSGANATGIGSHEAGGFETFPIENFRKLLKPGKNVVAIEGHNAGLTSSDFSLDPVLIAKKKYFPIAAARNEKKPAVKRDPFEPVRYSSASKRLVVFDRKSGRLLWQRDAEFSFRHNCVIAADGKVFCIDGLSPSKIQLLKRRGINASGKAKLLALDAKTGKVVWSTTENVFGTFLNYSKLHDVLLQAGSAYRDRAKDEVSRGMVAYRGNDGNVLWKDLDLRYGGPCLLWKDKIITNGAGGFRLDLLTGRKTGWSYGRMYGCNTAVGCQNLLTFRSGAAGFYDLTHDSGTGNIGGFKSGCTSNLIAADGVLNAPDYTRTCTCAYQNQTSLALIHMPENEFWTFNRGTFDPSAAKRIGLNLGAPGDRRSADGTLWFDVPSVGGPSPDVSVKTEPESIRWFQRHSSVIQTDGKTWVAASGAEGLRKLTLKLNRSMKDARQYSVRLYFAEPDDVKAGQRVFAVALQGKTVLPEFDVVKSAGGTNRLLVKEFPNVTVAGTLEVTLDPATGSARPPLLCGVELIRSK